MWTANCLTGASYGLFTWSKVQNFLQNVQLQKFCKNFADFFSIILQLFCNFFAVFFAIFLQIDLGLAQKVPIFRLIFFFLEEAVE